MRWAVLAMLVGCSPSGSAFHGLWANTDEGTVRAFRFFPTTTAGAEQRDDYEIYVYPEGSDDIRVQWGAYWIEEGILVTEVYWPDVDYGQRYGNDLLSFSQTAFVIETTDGGTRTYERVDALP